MIRSMVEMEQPKKSEIQHAPSHRETEATVEEVTAGFSHFGELLAIEGLDEHIPNPEVRQKLQDFREKFVEFLTGRVSTSFDKASEQAQTGLGTLAEILNGLPQGVAKLERTKDKKTVSLTIEGPTNFVRLDIDLGEERRAQRIRLGLRDAEDNETLVLDVHYYPPRNCLQMELRGKGLGKGILRHENFPAECSEQETFTQLQLLLAFNLCPTEGENDKTTAHYLTTKETYLKQLLKELGMKGKVAKDKKREEIIKEIMARCPGTPGYKETQKQRTQKAQRKREKAEKAQRKREEVQRTTAEVDRWLQEIDKCETTLKPLIETDKTLPRLVETIRKELALDDGVPSERVLLAYLLGVNPKQLEWVGTAGEQKEAKLALRQEMGEAASIIPNLSDIIETTALRRMEANSLADLYALMRQTLDDIKDQIDGLKSFEPES